MAKHIKEVGSIGKAKRQSLVKGGGRDQKVMRKKIKSQERKIT